MVPKKEKWIRMGKDMSLELGPADKSGSGPVECIIEGENHNDFSFVG